MINIGQFNDLEVVKEVDFGLYLDGGPFGEILLPKSYTSPGMEVGTDVRVFLYNDTEDRVIATTKQPKIVCDQFACLQVKEVTSVGAFLDWGLDGKDLLVPFSEQRERMNPGEWHVVFAYLDEATSRIVASSKLGKFLRAKNDSFEENQAVQITIAYKMPIGYKVIINDTHLGVLYKNEIFKEVHIGDQETGFVKHIREDKLIDVSLQRQGYMQQIPDACKQVIQQLEQADGFLPLHDKSTPEAIKTSLNMSKKAFKKAVGYLYKQKMIILEKDGIRLKY